MTIGKRVYYVFFDFRVDIENHQLLKNGEPVQLTPKTFQVLTMLVCNSGQTTRKEDIFNKLWPDSFVEDSNLTQHIHVLRKVLGRMPDERPYIETVPKQGYRFTLQRDEISVVTVDAEQSREDEPLLTTDPATLSGNEIHITDPQLNVTQEPEGDEDNILGPAPERHEHGLLADASVGSNDRRLSSRLLAAALVLILGLMAASGAVYYFRQSAQQSDAAHTRSIAVLPFRLIGGEVDKDKLGLGMADAVITQLSKDPQLEVRPTSAIFRYVEAPDGDSIELGRQLGVDVVLEGTIQREGDQVKVSVQLLQMPEGNSLLAESFYEKASDIFVVQDLISKRIVTALSLRLTPQQESFLSDRGQRKADPQFGPLFPK